MSVDRVSQGSSARPLLPDAYVGWRSALLTCLKDALESSNPTEPRTALLLAVVAHLPLCPHCGLGQHDMQIAEKLHGYLKNAHFTNISQDAPPSVAQRLLDLEWKRSRELPEKDTDENEDSAGKSPRRKQHNIVIDLENFFCVGSDGFAPEESSTALYKGPRIGMGVIEDSTLEIMYTKLAGPLPNEFSAMENFAHSLSVFSRLTEDAEKYGDVLERLLLNNFPTVGKNGAVTAWELMLTLLLRGSCNFLHDEIKGSCSPCFPFQRMLLENMLCCAKKMADCFNVHMHSDGISNYLSSDSRNFLYDGVMQFQRLLVVIVNILMLPLRSNCDTRRVLSVISSGLLVCREQQFIMLIWQLFIFFGFFVSSHPHILDVCKKFLSNFVRFSDQVMLRKRPESFAGWFLKVTNMAPTPYKEMWYNDALFHDVITEIRALSAKVFTCSFLVPSLWCASSNVVFCGLSNASCSQGVDDSMGQRVEMFVRQHPIADEQLAGTSSDAFTAPLLRRIGTCTEAMLLHLLEMLSSICPFLPAKFTEKICVAVLMRFKNECQFFQQSRGNTDNSSDNITFQCVFIAEFLAKHLTGHEAIVLTIREVVLPIVDRFDGSETSFSLVYAICQRCIAIESQSASSKILEELAESLCVRFGRELAIASADIWTLIGAADFAFPLLHVTDLLLFLLACCETKGFWSSFVERVGQYSLKFVGIAIDWAQAPTEIYSHICRIGQLFASSLHIALAANVTEKFVLEQVQYKLLSTEPLISNVRLLGSFIQALLQSIYSPLFAEQLPRLHSADRCVKASVNEKFRLQILDMAVVLLQKHLQDSNNVSAYTEYCIRNINHTIRCAIFSEKWDEDEKVSRFDELKPVIRHLLEALAASSVSASCFKTVLILYLDLVSVNPTPFDLKSIFLMTRKANYLQIAVLGGLLKLLRNVAVEPNEVFMFPQKAHENVQHPLEGSESMQSFESLDEPCHDRTSSSPLLSPSEGPHGHFQCSQVLSESLTNLARKRQNVVAEYNFDRYCAAQLNLTRALRLTDGLTVSFWLRTRKCRRMTEDASSERLPVCSIGTQKFSFLLQLSSDGCSLYLSNVVNAEINRTKHLRLALVDAAWNHITVSLIIIKSTSLVNISINSRHFLLHMKYGFSKPPEQLPFIFGFGALRKGSNNSALVYELSPFIAFRGQLSVEQVLMLRAIGCDCCSLAACNIGSLSRRLTSLLSAEYIFSNQSNILNLLSDVGTAFTRLQHNFLLSIRDSVAYVHSKFNGHCNLDNMEHGHLPPPERCLLKWNCYLDKRWRKSSIDDCFLSLGSQNLFIFMFAQAIDLKYSEYVQALAFRLLIQFLQRISPFVSEYSLTVYHCMTRCLSSPLARLGAQMLHEFRRGCIASSPSDDFSCDVWKESLIVDPELAVSLICTPHIWKGRERMKLWRSLLEDVACCISEKTSNCASFSTKQLARVNFLRKFFQACLEMLQDGENYLVESDGLKPLVEVHMAVVSAMIGSQAPTEQIVHLWNFIFLSHPAAHTYITYGYSDHFRWLQEEVVDDEIIFVLSKDSDLVRCLKDYVNVLGEGRIAEIWAKERSVIALRRLYEAGRMAADPVPEWPVDTQLRDNGDKKNLPDLVSGIEVTEGSTSDDCTAKEPSANEEGCLVEWFSFLRCRAVEYLAEIIQCAPDASVDEVVNMRISWQAVIALLTSQPNQHFRDHLFSLLKHILLRASVEVRIDFIRNGGFELLSNQMRGYPATDEMASSLFSLLFEEPVRLSHGLDPGHLSTLCVNHFQCLSFKAIFALWEESVCYSSLSVYWNISSALKTIFKVNEFLMQAMMDTGLCPTMVSILRRIAALPSMETDFVHVNASVPFMECWFALLKRIIRVCVPYRNSHLYEKCQKLLWLLEMAALEASTQSERTIRQGLSCALGLWLLVLQDAYFNDDASEKDSVSELLAGDVLENVDDMSSSSTLQDTASKTSFLTETVSAVRGSIADFRDYMKCPYKSRCSKCIPSTDERTRRLIYCITEISHFFIIMPSKSPDCVTNQEKRLFEKFLMFLLAPWRRSDSDAAAFERQSIKQRLLSACGDVSQRLLGQLVAFVLFPAPRKVFSGGYAAFLTDTKKENWEMKKRLMIVRSLASTLSNISILKSLLDVDLEYQYALNLSLHELALLEDVEDESAQKDVENLIKFLRNLQIESALATLSTGRLSSLNTDESLAVQGYLEYRNQFLRNMQLAAVAYVNEEKNRAKSRSEVAMRVTCRIVEDQNALRKNFIKTCRESEVRGVAAEHFLDDLVTQLCHTEGIFHDPESWPSSWALDPTEGPNWERRRLMCSHLTFDAKFLQSKSVSKVKKREKSPPLFHLLGGLKKNLKEWSLMDGLAPGERISLSLPAVVVRSTVESSGEILAGDKKFYFYSDCTRSTQKGLYRASSLFISWSYEHLIDIYKRHHLLEDTALEIFLLDGQTYLIVFEEQSKRDQFASQLLSSELCKLTSFSNVSIQLTTQLWREGTITNFEYLMQLNKLAGRSYNDLMQYPIFPFVLSNYNSSTLDLNDNASFRDLSRPMAIQDKRMEQHYLRNYRYLENEAARAMRGCGSPFIFGPYHYGSHYSNSGIVVHYLVRLPPFTDIALEYQDNNFDIADRLFNSIETTWRLASFESTTDFKELIPEFFYLPDFLVNAEGLNLGMRQNGDVVNDVILPKWCLGSPRLFVLIHRQALEALTVSATLNHWIDLIFGYKQTGKAAIDAINVFHPATYRANTMNSMSEEPDELSLSALRTMVKTYGQMPSQLFHSPHLPHLTGGGHHSASKISFSPLETVSGIRWGEFVGSPDSEFGNLNITLNELSCDIGHIAHVVAFSDGICFAFPSNTCLVYKAKEGVRSRELCCYGLLTWRCGDGMLRLRLQEPKLWWNLSMLHTYTVTATAYCASYDLLFVGLSCGIIHIYRILLCEFGVKDYALVKTLYAHSSAVRALAICGGFAVAASGCDEGKVCIWDVNRMAFVRTLVQSNGKETQRICISRTNCDVAVAARSGYGSCVTLYTINGLEVGHFETDIAVTALAMTSLPEGIAVNCLFVGMQNGIIRIFDMWTLKAVRDIIDYNFLEPIASMCFSNRCTRLFVCLASGRVLCWQGENLQLKQPPSLRIVTDT